jgi:peroxiredoxin Q/BCP
MIQAGEKAPDFALQNAKGEMVRLSDFAGKKLILYFYPKDNTPGCTRQACAFRDAFVDFESLNAVIAGVSKDSAASHQKFADKFDLPFVLLSDPELQAIQAYGVWQEKKLYGKVSMGVVRTTFVIDENGVVEKVFEKVKPDLNPGQVLAYLKG